MGEKGAKGSSGAAEAAERYRTILESAGDVSATKMFGGHGVFESGSMFGMVDSKGILYLKADDSMSAELEKSGYDRHTRMPYYKVLDSVLENAPELHGWAAESIKVAHRGK